MKHLYDLKPPGAYYREWETLNGTDEEVTRKINALCGADSDEALTVRFMVEYRANYYGPHIPLQAARQIDRVLLQADVAPRMAKTLGVSPEEVREVFHDLHDEGQVLIADDGSLWTTIPPGNQKSESPGQWTFVEQKVKAPLT